MRECPGTTDFRQEQCSRYSGKEFLGRAYDWEPFMDAPNQCALNCRARGFRFYATLNATVEDGTPCRGYIIGHDTDRWICVAGQCKSSTNRSNGSPSLGLDSLTHLPNEGLVRDGSWATATNPEAGIVHSGRYFHLLTYPFHIRLMN
ncbi:hypothetical protein J6590_023715 [Homalodisca vitripennis]|nr:hypothetical protein J6590_023715 [Homalodisca vitripennis]